MNNENNRRKPINPYRTQTKTKDDKKLRRKQKPGSNPMVDYIMHLQRTVGNRSVEQLVAGGALQPDSIMREINDCNAHEAHNASESLIRSKAPDIWLGLKAIQARDAGVESGIRNMKGGGQSLSSSVARFYESRIGHDFSNVRVHTGPQADSLAKSINARAFTTGSDIFFAGNEYSPATRTGKMLLAHELTHVVQQGKGLKRSQINRKTRKDKDPLTEADFKKLEERYGPGAKTEFLGLKNSCLEF
ncbi:MAG: DUF4157 domain-containing protein [bacterium]|nr:DUF4157 domain-containing protein [bacterium]